MNLLEEWNNINPLTDVEQAILNTSLHHKENETSDLSNIPEISNNEEDWKALQKQYFDLMPGCNLDPNNQHLTFERCCSNFIYNLFSKYVDDETLVISSDCEHPNVKKCLANCKNTLILSQHDDIRKFNLNKVADAISKYNKIFVYMIGMRNDTGEITPQSFMQALKILLSNKKHIIVLDDVQGMFFFPRDYSLYDYVLGTGHVAVPKFDMGIMISKTAEHGIKATNWGNAYLNALRIVIKRLEKLCMFRYTCNKYFANFIQINTPSQSLAAPHIFYLQNDNFKISPELSLAIEKIHLLIMPNTTNVGGIRMRALGYITDPASLSKAVKMFSEIVTKNTVNEEVLKRLLND